MTGTTEIYRVDAHGMEIYIEALANLLKDVVNSGASIGFMPPIDHVTAQSYWLDVCKDVAAGTKLLLVAVRGGHVIGSAQLGLEMRENGRHRAEVQKVIVHSTYRREGLGSKFMIRLEDEAKRLNRTLLILDTRRGDPSEILYQNYGYTQAGIIPQYARSSNGKLHDTVFYYKILS